MIELLTESCLSTIYQHVKNHSVGVITAHRQENDEKINESQNRKLTSYLSSKGYNITLIEGCYIENLETDNQKEVKEKTLFVVNPKQGDDGGELELDLVKLGQLYGQDSILSYRNGGKPTYVGTSDRMNVDPALGQRTELDSIEWGSPRGPYFSSIRNKKWTYMKSIELDPPTTVNGLTTRYLSAQEIQRQLNERFGQ